MKRPAIADGAGMSTEGTPAPTTMTSQRKNRKSPEQDRDREADDAACALVLGSKMRQGPQSKARREP